MGKPNDFVIDNETNSFFHRQIIFQQSQKQIDPLKVNRKQGISQNQMSKPINS
jgi:hypothetical protein